ncbi:MAG: pyridoxal-phosphate dependent enzyme [Chitinophagaceae bacterium]
MVFNNIIVQSLNPEAYFSQSKIAVDVLRLDLVHPVISGNKYFKLKLYLQEAITSKASGIGTFGGAYSNHIVACAFACKEAGIPCTGIIRGEEPVLYSPTLNDAKKYGMSLHFISRQEYRDKEKVKNNFKELFWIEEGGYGKPGAAGIAEIFKNIPDADRYNYIICAVGTGTMMAGLIMGAQEHQQVIGFSVMKNNFSLEEKIRELLPERNKKQPILLLHDFHFGGYAKRTAALIDFMNTIWNKYLLPLDFVYTAKAFYAMDTFIKINCFPQNSKILFIHSGGLQGNRSLPVNTLQF